MKTERKPKVCSQVLSKGIRGKRVDFVEHDSEDGLHVGISFTDRTYLSLRFNSQIVRESAELLKGGNVRKVFKG